MVGSIDEFPPGHSRVLELGATSIGIYNIAGAVHAVLNRCPHRGAPICNGVQAGTMLPSPPGEVRYGANGKILRCPWHGWEFDIESGSSVVGIGGRLHKYRAGVEGNDVVVYVGRT